MEISIYLYDPLIFDKEAKKALDSLQLSKAFGIKGLIFFI